MLGADSYLPMRAVLKAALGEKLSGPERAAFTTVAGDREPPAARVSTLGIVAGRAAGKTEAGAALAIYMACCVQWRTKPGQTPIILLLAADKEQAGVSFRFVRGQLEASPLLSREVTNVTANKIELRNGTVIQVGTSDFVSVRGPTFSCVICDEIAYWPTSLTSASPDVEVIAALRPGLARLSGSMMVLISSPYGQVGALFDTWKRAFGQHDPHTLVVHGGTRQFNSTFPQSEIDRALVEDAARYGAEYLAHWRTDVAAFVDAALVDSCTRSEPRELPRRLASGNGTPTIYIAGLDASGGRSDATACAIAHLDDDGLVVVDAARRWPAPHDPGKVAAQVAEFLKSYGISTADSDQYAAGFSRSTYASVGITLIDAPGTRSDSYHHLLPLMTQARIELPPDPTLRVELLSLERRVRSGGRDVIDHRAGARDDEINAVALAAWRASRSLPSGDLQISFGPSSIDVDVMSPWFDLGKARDTPPELLPPRAPWHLD